MANSLVASAMQGADPAAMDGMEDAPGDIASLGPEVDQTAMQTPAPEEEALDEAGDDMPTVSVEELQEYIQKQAYIDVQLRSLLDANEPISRKKVINVCVGIVARRVMSAQAMAGFLKDLPTEPQAIREWVEQHAKEGETQLEQMLEMLHGTVDPEEPMSAFGPASPGTPPQAPPSQPLQ